MITVMMKMTTQMLMSIGICSAALTTSQNRPPLPYTRCLDANFRHHHHHHRRHDQNRKYTWWVACRKNIHHYMITCELRATSEMHGVSKNLTHTGCTKNVPRQVKFILTTFGDRETKRVNLLIIAFWMCMPKNWFRLKTTLKTACLGGHKSSTAKYQPALPSTDPVPPNTNQYSHTLTQYHQVPTGIAL